MMYYREVEFNERKPANTSITYFYISYSGGATFGYFTGLIGHIESHLKEYPDHKIVWLEPECDYDADTYYKRISE